MKPLWYFVIAAGLGGSGALAYSQLGGGRDKPVAASVEILDAGETEGARGVTQAEVLPPPDADLLPDPNADPAVDPASAALPNASAAAPRLCNGEISPEAPGSDGRLFGHFPYAEAAQSSLAAPPAALAGGNCQYVHSAVVPNLTALLKAAKADGVSLTALSCFRSVSYQRGVFCNAAKLASQGGVKGRAKSSAPPGYSEHATGYVIDFGDRTAPGTNLEASFGGTKAGKWLAANARSYGYEMSFPRGNAQGVTFEPWHFRWTGNADAKATFSTARSSFPGE
jgi:zinc D-Ala-D-Ala carboxypeptidase